MPALARARAAAHHARPRRGVGDRARRGGDVRGPDRGARRDARLARLAAASLHAGAARFGAEPRGTARAPASDPGNGTAGDGLAQRLPLPYALRAGGRALRRGGAGAAGGRGGARGGVPCRVVSAPLLDVRSLAKRFELRGGLFGRSAGVVHAVQEVDLRVAPGETLGLVGESGCGKTTVGRSLLRLVEPSAGEILYRAPRASLVGSALEGRGRTEGDRAVLDVRALRGRELRALRRHLQIVFQDPFASLNPRLTVGQALSEPLVVHGLARGAEARARVAALLERVGLRPEHAARYPHEFSGGQRQRIGIARALALEPRFVVLDEAVSALDVSVQAQVLNLLLDLQRDAGLAYLFIAHDLAVVRYVAQRVAVMYLGRIVEEGPSAEVLGAARHPYTRALIAAAPRRSASGIAPRLVLAGEPPSPLAPPAGCAFHPRCPLVEERCRSERPLLLPSGGAHQVACHLASRGAS
ncbi:MAG: ATP-binding cassette domain-containing protein [Planctomycetes bacterium]|nr:ATP-binding cassette domain-containing protein [Planctomycetota bacterium]